MPIGILGGSFNPPHIGHILLAQQVLDFTDIDKIWWLPVYKHTFDKPLAAVEHRLRMLELVNYPRMQVSTLEIDYKLDGNTINLIPLLKKENPNHEFTFIIGSDQLSLFHKWGKWQELLTLLPFLVVPRAGYPLMPLYKGMQTLQHTGLIITNISSSLIRFRIKQRLPFTHFVTERVEKYIKKHSLYF